METIFIVNVDAQSFFRYEKQNEKDVGYNKILSKLLTPPIGETISHWLKTYKIVFSPNHLKSYVEKHYNELL